jgi:hypothetical protein
MKLTIFGASGATGTCLVRQALDAGHEVTAVVCDPARLTVPARRGRRSSQPTSWTRPHDQPSSGGCRRGDHRHRLARHRCQHAPPGQYPQHHAGDVQDRRAQAAVRQRLHRRRRRREPSPALPAQARSAAHVTPARQRRLPHRRRGDPRQRPRLDDLPPAVADQQARQGTYRVAIDRNLPRCFSITRADLAACMLSALEDPATIHRHICTAN